jgi:hypothetical protein
LKENLIEKILLVTIIVLLATNTWQSCNNNREQMRIINRQLKVSDSTKTIINNLITARRDSIIKENNTIREIIKWKERAKDEILQTNNIDSLIGLYYRARANNTPD